VKIIDVNMADPYGSEFVPTHTSHKRKRKNKGPSVKIKNGYKNKKGQTIKRPFSVKKQLLKKKSGVKPAKKINGPLYEESDGTLPEGWRIEYVVRKGGASEGHIDRYWHPPSGKRLRSRVEVRKYLEGE